jgi:hypothetical protein
VYQRNRYPFLYRSSRHVVSFSQMLCIRQLPPLEMVKDKQTCRYAKFSGQWRIQPKPKGVSCSDQVSR